MEWWQLGMVTFGPHCWTWVLWKILSLTLFPNWLQKCACNATINVTFFEAQNWGCDRDGRHRHLCNLLHFSCPKREQVKRRFAIFAKSWTFFPVLWTATSGSWEKFECPTLWRRPVWFLLGLPNKPLLTVQAGRVFWVKQPWFCHYPHMLVKKNYSPQSLTKNASTENYPPIGNPEMNRTWKAHHDFRWTMLYSLPGYTAYPPKFNMEPENNGFQKDFPFPVTYFQVLC